MDSINQSHPTTERKTSPARRPDKSNPAAEVGWFLRRERERFNCSLEDAALATRINRRYLAAIEDGDLIAFPDPDDALRYLTTYASFLGFEPAPLAQHYVTVLDRIRIHSPAERALRSTGKVVAFPGIGTLRSSTMGVLLAVFVATGIFGGAAWIIIPGLTGGSSGSLPVVRADGTPVEVGDPITTASVNSGADDTAATETAPQMEPAADNLTSQDAAPAGGTPAGDDELGGLTEFIQQNVSGTVATEPVSKPSASKDQQSRVFGTENDNSRLVLKANAPVWVRIEDRQGNVVLTKTMMVGDAYRVPNRNDLVVIARDGGALTYIVDGKESGTLGAPGEILVGRSLDLAALNKKS
ncbi:cytoskeleton protein RodZ [Rhodoligotrophos appendicifer]|uniref:helix-turn-helix domain-containing protein n=1 Tax=Rhodoligotrophos appendicifer TaxID=987056 RepID=UPI001180B19F|nr:helix-turn-helix domain-containing protein [Rhodoligotrophos appendicifer]